ncbi:PilZ domain-containing protein [Pelotalea chapellei]|uniref:PilZ domain-containing protein n=1 Tax=Pelotalea chapellei TaxID=44671 RepID=A0ABS5U5W8_9BACT|nr:PilZ domain-containing protein [Pelotalea chapellei]MBT1071048.1 PilZ domain-containing protein [Pelotalea chapellei]
MSCSRRQGERIKSYEKLVLSHNGRSTVCFLEDISPSGAMINCYDSLGDALDLGDSCTIKLFDTINHCLREIRCNVSRHHSTQIGLQFSCYTTDMEDAFAVSFDRPEQIT